MSVGYEILEILDLDRPYRDKSVKLSTIVAESTETATIPAIR